MFLLLVYKSGTYFTRVSVLEQRERSLEVALTSILGNAIAMTKYRCEQLQDALRTHLSDLTSDHIWRWSGTHLSAFLW